jgi:hypothetical protein
MFSESTLSLARDVMDGTTVIGDVQAAAVALARSIVYAEGKRVPEDIQERVAGTIAEWMGEHNSRGATAAAAFRLTGRICESLGLASDPIVGDPIFPVANELCPNCKDAVLEDESRMRPGGLGCPACGLGFTYGLPWSITVQRA